MALGHVRDDMTRGHVECRVEVGGTCADVIMGPSLGEPRTEREHRLCAVEGLDLGCKGPRLRPRELGPAGMRALSPRARSVPGQRHGYRCLREARLAACVLAR